MRSIRRALALLALAAGGCTATLAPAPEAQRLAENAAIAAGEGVRLVARVEAWQDAPRNLAIELTPILVTVMNHGQQPIRVVLEDFTLTAADGEVYRALSPFRIQGSVPATIDERPYPVHGFFYAPHMLPYYRGMAPYAWRGGWPRRDFFGPYAGAPAYIGLPTVDMLRQALPEGVLEPGGQVSGFVYFERLADDAKRITLQAKFPPPSGEAPIATLEIPFTAK